MNGPNLLCAAAETDITACGSASFRGVPVAGCRIHDRLRARLLLFAGSDGESLWIAADECRFRRGAAATILDALERRGGIPSAGCCWPGPIGFFAQGGDPFVRLCRDIERSSGLLTLGVAGPYMSYFPDAASFPQGGYEVNESQLGPESLARLPGLAAALAESLASNGSAGATARQGNVRERRVPVLEAGRPRRVGHGLLRPVGADSPGRGRPCAALHKCCSDQATGTVFPPVIKSSQPAASGLLN
jgi:hypothetical protein